MHVPLQVGLLRKSYAILPQHPCVIYSSKSEERVVIEIGPTIFFVGGMVYIGDMERYLHT